MLDCCILANDWTDDQNVLSQCGSYKDEIVMLELFERRHHIADNRRRVKHLSECWELFESCLSHLWFLVSQERCVEGQKDFLWALNAYAGCKVRNPVCDIISDPPVAINGEALHIRQQVLMDNLWSQLFEETDAAVDELQPYTNLFILEKSLKDVQELTLLGLRNQFDHLTESDSSLFPHRRCLILTDLAVGLHELMLDSLADIRIDEWDQWDGTEFTFVAFRIHESFNHSHELDFEISHLHPKQDLPHAFHSLFTDRDVFAGTKFLKRTQDMLRVLNTAGEIQLFW